MCDIPLQSTYILHSLFLTIASRHYSLIVGVRACSTHFGYIDVMDNGESQPFVHIVCCFEAAARRDNYRRQLCMKQNWQENEKFRWLTNGSGDTDKDRGEHWRHCLLTNVFPLHLCGIVSHTQENCKRFTQNDFVLRNVLPFWYSEAETSHSYSGSPSKNVNVSLIASNVWQKLISQCDAPKMVLIVVAAIENDWTKQNKKRRKNSNAALDVANDAVSEYDVIYLHIFIGLLKSRRKMKKKKLMAPRTGISYLLINQRNCVTMAYKGACSAAHDEKQRKHGEFEIVPFDCRKIMLTQTSVSFWFSFLFLYLFASTPADSHQVQAQLL